MLMNGWLKAGVTYELQFVVTNPLGQAMDRKVTHLCRIVVFFLMLVPKIALCTVYILHNMT